MIFSRYLRTRTKNNRVVIFHELHPDPVYCEGAIWEVFKSNPSETEQELLANLRARGLVINSREEDDEDLRSTEEKVRAKFNHPAILYLMMTHGCNLNCAYCPIPELATRDASQLLSLRDAMAGIELWKNHIRESGIEDRGYTLIFYGGEPLLNRRTIEQVLEQVRLQKGELPHNLEKMVATNGVLADEAFANLCLEHEVSVAIGLDGPEDAHNALRPYLAGGETFQDVIRSIRLLVGRGVKTYVSATVTPWNLDSISSYPELFGSLGVDKFGFNFLRGRMLRMIVPTPKLRSEYFRKAAQAIIDCCRMSPGYEYQLDKKVRAFRGDPFPQDCTCYGSQLVVHPDGQVSNCPFSGLKLGHLQDLPPDFRICKTKVVGEWRKRLPLHDPAFRDCDAKSVCGPGCAWSSLQTEGDILSVDEGAKVFSEEVFDELIWGNL